MSKRLEPNEKYEFECSYGDGDTLGLTLCPQSKDIRFVCEGDDDGPLTAVYLRKADISTLVEMLTDALKYL